MRHLAVLVTLVMLLIVMSRFVALPDSGEPIAAAGASLAEETGIPAISVLPDPVLQGDPVLITIDGVAAASGPTSIAFDDRPLPVFTYEGKSAAIAAIDLDAPAATHVVMATLPSGAVLKRELAINKRAIVQAPLDIPDKLGGNTGSAVRSLTASLARENAILASLPSAHNALWKEPFGYPVADPVVTDPYGYARITVGATISHKGTDFHAATGTPVLAMNDGVVEKTGMSSVYGNTVVIDHGAGIQTLYLHLSKILVAEGERVTKGEVIGASGDTGYAVQPHLHVSVKINGISIDPMRFLSLFMKAQ